MSGWVKVTALNFFIIKIRGGLGIGMGVRDRCGPTDQKGDGTINVVEHSPCPTTYLNFLLVGNVEHRTVSIETELKSGSERSRAFGWSTCEEPIQLLIDVRLYNRVLIDLHVTRCKQSGKEHIQVVPLQSLGVLQSTSR